MSHSSHTDEEKAFLRSFVSALQDDSLLEARVDIDLYAGGDWNLELNVWMAECHAAVVLLTPSALDRPWVLKEVTTLVWRASLDAEFTVLPVWFDGVDEDSVKASPLGPVFLERMQSIPGGDAAAVAEAVKSRLAVVADRVAEASTPLGRLTATLSDALAKAPTEGLEEVISLMGIEASVGGPRRKEEYADLIARKLVQLRFARVRSLVDLINSLRTRSGFTSESAKQVLGMLAPMWIPAEDAGRLPALRDRKTGAFAALNGDWLDLYTVDMYLHRAYPLDLRWRRIPIRGGFDDGPLADAIAAQIRDGFRAGSPLPLRALSDEKVDEMLGEDRPRFVLIPDPHPDEEVLLELHGIYPRLTFILDTGREPLEPEALPGWVERLPVVDLDIEKQRADDYFEAFRIAEGSGATG
ncbi:MAG: toll/interleukin-1 receptor domain-containing protein [Solirubrobacteraceae bacterium]